LIPVGGEAAAAKSAEEFQGVIKLLEEGRAAKKAAAAASEAEKAAAAAAAAADRAKAVERMEALLEDEKFIVADKSARKFGTIDGAALSQEQRSQAAEMLVKEMEEAADAGKTLTDQEVLVQSSIVRSAKVKPGELRGATANTAGQTGHALGKHLATAEETAEIINNATRKFVGINANGRRVNVFWQNGNVVITEGDDVTRIITTYGEDFVTKLPGGRVVPGKAIDPSKWADNPLFHEVK
jgi:hypothetical protein